MRRGQQQRWWQVVVDGQEGVTMFDRKACAQGAEVDSSGESARSGAEPDLQFYQTPMWLAKKVWDKVEKEPARVLDACAGTGDLTRPLMDRMQDMYRRRGQLSTVVDAVEIDAQHHPTLRALGMNLVGLDFLSFEGGVIYDLIVLNPPFATGARHVLKAFDALYKGQVVAIINAQTIRQPFGAERQRLVKLIEETGSVEFVEDAFRGEGVRREANVDVAIVCLNKSAECQMDWIGRTIESLSIDKSVEVGIRLPTELALPDSFVENQVKAFNAAVASMRQAANAQAVATHFANRIGMTMADRQNEVNRDAQAQAEEIQKALSMGYMELKDRSWASILRSTDVLKRLSSAVRKSAEASFETIKMLDFSVANVYGFLLGLIESKPEMDMQMVESVFDIISKYHTDNGLLYRAFHGAGWKSNDKHRTCGMRIKHTRFILPGHSTNSWSHKLPFESEHLLADIDKVFCLLDGKHEAPFGLVNTFSSRFAELRRGERVQSEYFGIRYFARAGTIHFYPARKDLVERLNRVVGARRAWIPAPNAGDASAFWKQYEAANKLDAEMRAEISKARPSRWHDPIRVVMMDNASEGEVGVVRAAMDRVLERHGLLEALTAEEATHAELVEHAEATRQTLALAYG